ncbi:anhydro-N-acetylmuramic acid kinase [Nitrosomonas cryotolerans]|uniref:Anhydro-N-acetylmuramic acid kinase n=1 Tax=Nitrosomonas cryotolerans ATCC 49181 TaxID=1131553 RepID=A0A1N6I7P7_9PROT|nr:anhydro-N-acetylmuramic acid kinase [Nitrosomonas cryotolerans]SFP96994.1 anhydro-N-acetylmuramic acid kinase [Nitrosomonas cryotolerans]SIO27965.1 anhydro-N-acetylmuramic acid kinase [Nitrosomonas cryotolerans ATCC 49181]
MYYIGIMSGTSLDGIDVGLADFSSSRPTLVCTAYLPYDEYLRNQLLELHQSGDDELHRAAMLGNQLSRLYAQSVNSLLKTNGIAPQCIVAIGCHGQTVRHCPEPEKGYTIQLVNAALLAELTHITVITDFRSRDIAAGGQGAPLVPAFHQALFKSTSRHRVIVNIGGISNITDLEPGKTVIGFDCGPGNLLMDAWCLHHTGQAYDKNGEWAASGQVIPMLLEALFIHPFFSLPPPKSTGRETFNMQWLKNHLLDNERPEDVQATLLQLTATAVAQSILNYCPNFEEVYICGGGARNGALISQLTAALFGKEVALTDKLGVDADWVEAYAFAWLAQQTILGLPSNLAAVTGAQGDRILGAIYRA